MEQRNTPLFMWMYPVLLAFALGVLGWGIYLMAMHPAEQVILAAGCVGVIGVLLAWFITLNLRAGQQEVAARHDAILASLNEQFHNVSTLLSQVAEQQLISERAKTIAFRDNEREALRRAIREEAAKNDWESALMLANQIEAAFGYKQEADRIREEIRVQREMEVRKQVNEGLVVIDRHCRGEQWSLAMQEAERLIKAFPDDAQAQCLPQEIEARRQNLKKQLLQAWNEAVDRRDTDGSIEVLKQLDNYLTPAEAQSIQEQARQVFKDKLLLLGQQFAMAVKNHAWAEAIRLGESIMAEFPNSRMAQEVREKIDLLRQKATLPEPAKVG